MLHSVPYDETTDRMLMEMHSSVNSTITDYRDGRLAGSRMASVAVEDALDKLSDLLMRCKSRPYNELQVEQVENYKLALLELREEVVRSSGDIKQEHAELWRDLMESAIRPILELELARKK